jgi:uncharacterized coiled-coil DUF342 family protein
MDIIIQQAPAHLTIDEIEPAFKRNENNVLKTLNELWEIDEEIIPVKTKWDDIRETCDAYDNEMQKMMSQMKAKNKNNNNNN